MRAPKVLLATLLLPSLGGCPQTERGRLVDCNPGRTACILSGAQGTLRFEMSPRPIPLMTAFDVAVDTAANTDQVSVEFNGRDMEMGPNLRPLHSIDGRRWRGQATLPVCMSGRMRWQATLTLKRGAQSEQLRFEFDAGAP